MPQLGVISSRVGQNAALSALGSKLLKVSQKNGEDYASNVEYCSSQPDSDKYLSISEEKPNKAAGTHLNPGKGSRRVVSSTESVPFEAQSSKKFISGKKTAKVARNQSSVPLNSRNMLNSRSQANSSKDIKFEVTSNSKERMAYQQRQDFLLGKYAHVKKRVDTGNSSQETKIRSVEANAISETQTSSTVKIEKGIKESPYVLKMLPKINSSTKQLSVKTPIPLSKKLGSLPSHNRT